MSPHDSHISDEQLLLAADGELATRRADRVRAHLAACWDCRARMAGIEQTIANFSRAHHDTLDPHLPPPDGPRALLKAQLAQLAAQPHGASWRKFFPTAAARAFAYASLTVVIALAAGLFLVRHPVLRATRSAGAFLERGAIPNRNLTPGATRRVTVNDVCSNPHEEVVRDVPSSLRQKVFQEYGIANPRPEDYEVDYLIAPGLGGAEDIHNLWPEPARSRTWNAHVKDALEERLHEMVCSGQIDLSTAQQDIATDWISAYKKYFHTSRPLSLSSQLVPLKKNP